MGGVCCCCHAVRVIPQPPASEITEWDEYQRLARETLDKGNAAGWKIKADWPKKYRPDGFKMRVALRPHESGNPNMLLRADGKFKGASPQLFLDYLLNPDNLPGLKEWVDVETLPDGYIKYCKVKAPGMRARDHCWRYTVDKRGDGSIFVCIRTAEHPKCPPKEGVYRAYYFNSSLFKMSEEEPGVMEMTEFIFQDLGGQIPPPLMNAALPAGTLQANAVEMKGFRDKGLLTA
uniref:START domain-containing protein n=1 Tax=Hemiselmis tepida TaxID=464990 RepID=A0A7S0Z2J6_9CRYP|mmetsp:Transcript_4268/g.10978  ORF Transcript_4268/g.10978 Transcript_4268/m.10978 type:complete len:233 (+) Transcript_4268:88-786(+)